MCNTTTTYDGGAEYSADSAAPSDPADPATNATTDEADLSPEVQQLMTSLQSTGRSIAQNFQQNINQLTQAAADQARVSGHETQEMVDATLADQHRRYLDSSERVEQNINDINDQYLGATQHQGRRIDQVASLIQATERNLEERMERMQRDIQAHAQTVARVHRESQRQTDTRLDASNRKAPPVANYVPRRQPQPIAQPRPNSKQPTGTNPIPNQPAKAATRQAINQSPPEEQPRGTLPDGHQDIVRATPVANSTANEDATPPLTREELWQGTERVRRMTGTFTPKEAAHDGRRGNRHEEFPSFAKRFEYMAKYYQIPKANWAHMFATCLETSAHDEYLAMPEEQQNDYEQTIAHLGKIYPAPTRNEWTYRNQWDALRQAPNEPLREFIGRIESLAHKAHTSLNPHGLENEKITKFRYGLASSYLRYDLAAVMAETLQELGSRAIAIQMSRDADPATMWAGTTEASEVARDLGTTPISTARTAQFEPQQHPMGEVTRLPYAYPHIMPPATRYVTYVPASPFTVPATPPPAQSNPREIFPKKRQGDYQRGMDLASIRCYNCGELGHLANKCPRPDKRLQRNYHGGNRGRGSRGGNRANSHTDNRQSSDVHTPPVSTSDPQNVPPTEQPSATQDPIGRQYRAQGVPTNADLDPSMDDVGFDLLMSSDSRCAMIRFAGADLTSPRSKSPVRHTQALTTEEETEQSKKPLAKQEKAAPAPPATLPEVPKPFGASAVHGFNPSSIDMSELDLLSYFHRLDRWDNPPQNFLERLNSALADGRTLIDFTEIEKLLSAAVLPDVFLQANFTRGNDAEKLNISALGSVDVSVDGIDVSRNAKFTEILKFVKDALEPLQLESASLRTARVHVLHQKILTEPSKKVRDTIIENYSKFIDSRLFSELSDESKLAILIELTRAHWDYREVSKAADLVSDVLALAKMEPKLLGSLGKRTRYQEKLVAQMRVDVQAGGDAGRTLALATSDMPKNIVLNVESILNEVMYADDLAEVELSSLQYAALWALIRLKQYSTVRDKLLEEEISPYLNLILRKPNIWALHHGALKARSTWEKSASKKVERALAQVENLVNETRAQQPSGAIRTAFAFEISLMPIWPIEKLLASILSSLGCTREALEVYQRLNDIPNVIERFKSLGKLDRAEKIIRDHLAARKTPQMLTYLGDVTNNPVYYEEAWELSGHRYGMAQKNLGIGHLRREMHAQAMDAFNLAARTLVMSDQPWYNMGYCAMKLEDYPAAAKAFRRCVDIEPDSFHAWNNLAAAYTHMKELDKAFHIIQEALKANFENWKIWDNFLTLSVETRHWDEAIRSLHKLIDLQKSSIGGPLLIVLAERCDESSIEKLRELLARVTSTCATSDAWFAYAVALSRGKMTQIDAEKCTKAHQRSFAMMLQKDPNWNQSMESINSILDRSIVAFERYSVLAKDHGVPSIKQAFGSVRLNINSVLSRLSQMYEDGEVKDVKDEESLKEMASRAKVIINIVGPHRFYGEPVVKACVKNGSSMVDISGEPVYIDGMAVQYNEAAKNKVYIVPARSFNSIPCDLGCLFAKKQIPGDTAAIETAAGFVSPPGSGPINFKTFHSMIYGVANRGELRPIRRRLYNFRLPKIKFGAPKRNPVIAKLEDANGENLPSLRSDKPVTMRSQYYNYENNDDRLFAHKAYLKAGSFFQGVALIIGQAFCAMLAQFNAGRKRLETYPEAFTFGMFFKTGPTWEQVNTRGFKYWAIAYGYKNKLPKDEQHTSPHELKTTVRVDGPDSAYAGTSALTVAAARTIVLEPNALPTDGGIHNPGACFGRSNIIDRLNGRGVTFNVTQRNHILSSEISTRVTTLQTEFDRLQTLWEEKKRLHDLRLDAQQWHRDAPEMENWVKQREQYLRDGWKEASSVEDIEDTIRQHEDLPTTMDVNDAKVRPVIQFGDRLCQDNNYTVDKIHKKARNTEERRNANRGKALSTPEALKNALARQQFLSDCEKLREWSEEKMVKAQDETYREAKTVHFKSMRHQAFDSEIMSNNDRRKKLQETVVRLSSEKPKLMPNIDPQWDEPERTAKEKGEKLFDDGPEVTRPEDLPRQHRLAENEKAHSFLYDSNEAEAWMSEQKLYMTTGEHDKNDFSTENMVKKHERVQSDINAYGYADTIRELGERAQTLIDEKAPLNDQTAIRPPQADKLYTGLQDLSRERCHRLDETLQPFDRHREIDDLEHWITEREVVAASQELGQDLGHAQMLQERFRQFARDTKTIGTERVSRVNEQRGQMIAPGHRLRQTTKRANASRLMRKDGAEFLFSTANEQEMDDWRAKKAVLPTEPAVPSETAPATKDRMEADVPEPNADATTPQRERNERPPAPSASCVVGQ